MELLEKMFKDRFNELYDGIELEGGYELEPNYAFKEFVSRLLQNETDISWMNVEQGSPEFSFQDMKDMIQWLSKMVELCDEIIEFNKPKQMTLEEIEMKLGHRIEIVKGE